MLTFYEHRQQKPCVFVDFCTHSCALYVRETCAYYTLTVSHVHAPDCHRQYLNCKHFNTSTVHYILNLEGPLQFCNVILSLYFFFLHSWQHCIPIFGEMPIFNFWNSHWADGLEKEGAVRKKSPIDYLFIFWKPWHTGSRWMEGLIWQLWRAFQVALAAPEDALRNESTHSRACTLNCKFTTQAHMINVSGVPIALDGCLLLLGKSWQVKKMLLMTWVQTRAINK